MLGMKPMLRSGAAVGALLSVGLALFGCGNPSPRPTGDSSIIVPPQTPEPTSSVGGPAPEGSVPDLFGFELIFSVHYERPQAPHVDPSPQTELGTQPKPGMQPENSSPKNIISGSSTAPTNTVTSTGPAFDGVLVSEDYIAVYSNDLLEQTYEITGYRISSGTQEWHHDGSGILSCHDGDTVVCEMKTYTSGVWTTEDVWLFSLDVGGFQALDVGGAGTFFYVGDYDGVVYFLTWDGTRSIHMTGFDESGIPVVDKNLKVKAPTSAKNRGPETWMNGSHALVDYPGETPILYDAVSNLAAEVDVTAPCISVRNGVVCASSQDPGTIIGINDRMRESWRHTTTAVSLLDTASEDVPLEDFKDLFFLSQPPVTQIPDPDIVPGPGHPTPGKTAAATPGRSSAQVVVARGSDTTSGITVQAGENTNLSPRPTLDGNFPEDLDWLYATVADEEAVLLALADKILLLPGNHAVELGNQVVESVDLSRKSAIVNVSVVDPSPGESGSTRVLSSILVGKDGTVLSALPSARILEIFAQSDAAGQQIAAHTFTWKDDYLVFTDARQGTVAVYKQK